MMYLRVDFFSKALLLCFVKLPGPEDWAFVLFLQILTQHLTSTVSAPSSALNAF